MIKAEQVTDFFVYVQQMDGDEYDAKCYDETMDVNAHIVANESFTAQPRNFSTGNYKRLEVLRHWHSEMNALVQCILGGLAQLTT